MQMLNTRGADVNAAASDRTTACYAACEEGSVSVLRLLHKHLVLTCSNLIRMALHPFTLLPIADMWRCCDFYTSTVSAWKLRARSTCLWTEVSGCVQT